MTARLLLIFTPRNFFSLLTSPASVLVIGWLVVMAALKVMV